MIEVSCSRWRKSTSTASRISNTSQPQKLGKSPFFQISPDALIAESKMLMQLGSHAARHCRNPKFSHAIFGSLTQHLSENFSQAASPG